MDHELVTKKFSLPTQSTVDSMTEMFRAAVSQKGSVQKVVFSADPLELSVDVYVPVEEPGRADPPGGEPEDVWQVLATVDMEEVEPKDLPINVKAVSLITTLMLKAAERGMAGSAWAVGDVQQFLTWMGLPAKDDPPASFWNLPLIEVDSLQESTLVLMCARSHRLGPLRSEVGLLTHMEVEDA